MARKKAATKAAKKASSELDKACEFGSVTVGDGVASFGVAFSRDNLDCDEANAKLCGRRLIGRVLVTQNGESSAQSTNPDDVRHEVAGVFDCKSFRVSPKKITASLAFSIAEIDISKLAHFAKQCGRLVVDEIGEIKKPPKADANGQQTIDELAQFAKSGRLVIDDDDDLDV